MRSILRMAVGVTASATLMACGPAISSLEILVQPSWRESGAFDFGISDLDRGYDDCLILPGDTRVSANGRPGSMISLGATNNMFERIAGPACDGVVGSFPTPPADETNLTVSLGYEGQEATVEFQDLLGPTVLVPPSEVKAGEQIRVGGQVGTARVGFADLVLKQGASTWKLQSMNNGVSPYWSLPNLSDPAPPPPGAMKLDRTDLIFIVPADAQPGPVAVTTEVQRASSVVNCQDLQRCGASSVQSVSFTLNVVP